LSDHGKEGGNRSQSNLQKRLPKDKLRWKEAVLIHLKGTSWQLYIVAANNGNDKTLPPFLGCTMQLGLVNSVGASSNLEVDVTVIS
jgi:hypothetical protein